MQFSGIQQSKLKRYGRWVLVLFVLSWVNLIIQAPVHAGMKQEMALSQEMVNYHCSDTLCDTVLSLENQSEDIIHIVLPVIHDIQIAFVVQIQLDPQQSLSAIHIALADLHFREASPPPLLLKTTLLI